MVYSARVSDPSHSETPEPLASPGANDYKSIIVDEKAMNWNLSLIARNNLRRKREEFFDEVKENEQKEKDQFKLDFTMKNLTSRMDY